MPARFTPENWESMDNTARIALCHTMAVTALKLAKTSRFNVSDAFLRLAEDWSLLATEITRSSVEPPKRAPESIAAV